MNDPDNAPPTFRYASRRAGWLVLIAVTVFVIAILQAEVLREAFRSTALLRVILPDTGLSGLAEDSPVEILGTPAGRVVEIVIDPDEKLFAEVEIQERMTPFIRRDSEAFIRKQFGIAGAAYLEITRGRGEPLDWDYAVIRVESERGAAENIDQLIGDVRAQIAPILEDAGRAVAALADLSERVGTPGGDVDRIVTNLGTVSNRLAGAEGTIGRLIADDTLIVELEATATAINAHMDQIDVILEDLQATTGEVAKIGRTVGRKSNELAMVVDNTNATLVSLDRVLTKVDGAMPAVTTLVGDTTNATAALPTFLTQTQQTLAELETLLRQLQRHWLIGGGGDPPSSRPTRLSPTEIRR